MGDERKIYEKRTFELRPGLGGKYSRPRGKNLPLIPGPSINGEEKMLGTNDHPLGIGSPHAGFGSEKLTSLGVG